MKSIVAAVLLSLSLGAQARPEIANVDPENYVAKEVPPSVAQGGIRKLQMQQKNKPKGHLRALMYDDDYFYPGPDSHGGALALSDDQLVTEELISIEYYQDNRFAPAEPIFASAIAPALDAPGNRWLYANVPLQPIFGINDLPIQGLAQGYCEQLSDAGDGFCHFTYEFFDLRNGAIVVYASITAEGTTQPQGPTKLNILGGTGEFSGAVGEISLYPVGIDESIVPARIFKDGSMFLGNRNGYEAKFEVNVRYLINEPPPIPVPVAVPVPAPIPAPVGGVTTQGLGLMSGTDPVHCAGKAESEYCDCNWDCDQPALDRCSCQAAQACCSQR